MHELKRIFKFELNPNLIDRPQAVAMPAGARVLDIDWQPGSPTLSIWAVVDPEAPYENRAFYLAFTGSVHPEGWRYFRTVFVGQYVYHAYVGVE